MKLRGLVLCLFVAALGISLLAACNGKRQTLNANTLPAVNGRTLPLGPDKAPRITVLEARAAMEKGDAFFIDTRGAEAYKKEHIRGAINMPYGDAKSPIDQLPKDKLLIAYCD